MKRLIHLLTLLFFVIHLNSNAQTNIQQDWRVNPLLKQVDAKQPGLTIFGRKEEKYVNMAVLADSTRTLTWLTCYGQAFDSVRLTDATYSRIKSGDLNPFDYYRDYFFDLFSQIRAATALFRKEGKTVLKDTNSIYYRVYTYPSVQQVAGTLQKEIAMEKLMSGLCLQLSLFESRTPRQLIPNDSFLLRLQLAGRMISNGNTTIYYNTNPLSSACHIELNKQVPGKMFVYDRKGRLADSVPLKAGKYAALLNEKEDVFLLYRGWLELQSQQAIAAKEEVARLLNREYTMLYKPVYWEEHKQQLQQTLLEAEEQVKAEGDKVMGLIVPAPEETVNLLTAAYQNRPAEISYIAGVGFAYSLTYIRGDKRYELSNHLGNVLAVISDRKKTADENGDGSVDYYNADIVSAVDYLPFGGQMPGRVYNDQDRYRYGFNGKENDSEVKGEGGQQDYGMRIYDPRVARFLSVDPLMREYPWYTPYQFAGNNPIKYIDLDGGEPMDPLGEQVFYYYQYRMAESRGENGFNYVKQLTQNVATARINGTYYGFLGTIGIRVPSIGAPLILSDLLKVPVYPSPQALEGAVVSASRRAATVAEADAAAMIPKSPGSSLSAHPTNTLAPISRPVVVSDESYALLGESEVLDSKKNIIGTVSNSYGNLDLYVKTAGTEYAGRGPEVFKALVNSAMSKGTVTGINGTWSQGSLGSNLRAFNKAIQNGLSPERAAFETFTGSNAKDLGFKNVSINRLEGDPGEYFSVSVTFTK